MVSHAIARALTDLAHPGGRPYFWAITRDRSYELSLAEDPDTDEPNHQGKAGPGHHHPDAEAALQNGRGIPFRLYDQGDIDDRAWDIVDGVWRLTPSAVKSGHPDYGLVYEGLIYVLPDAEDDWHHAPLADFGAPHGSCTDVRYLHEDGVTWESR